MAIFTAHKQLSDNIQPIISFDYGVVLLITKTLSLPDYDGNPIYLTKEHLLGLSALLSKINKGCKTSEIIKPAEWFYQIQPGEESFRHPLEQIIHNIESNELPLILLED
ncbi:MULTISPECIES: hypothetical protein [unclassified Coleofasciculus]|uniref:hypothetical protein n=1 Tax=unclassified Coleofasciculus TaxID=2692782 RepID=UPI0018806B0A|nr:MULTISPECIES: hypothetical protein [unclassified Coleofasciculus]MBE9128590.1 hypothetical protein [Coleofasciculus sp. LEGE 07081]MBE9150680.1 hypothetical protein [Coleofasciculus sp. LEGE 07092]